MVVEIRETQDLEQLLELSKTDPVLIFKHSTQCPISDSAYQEFQRFTRGAGYIRCGLVLVIERREVSNAVAEQLGIRHESPQAIFVRDGRPVWNASHWSITADSLNKALNKNAESPRT